MFRFEQFQWVKKEFLVESQSLKSEFQCRFTVKKNIGKMVDFTLHLGKYTKSSNFQENFSIPPNFSFYSQICLGSQPGCAAKFFTAKWQFNSANFSLFGCEFRHLASLRISEYSESKHKNLISINYYC